MSTLTSAIPRCPAWLKRDELISTEQLELVVRSCAAQGLPEKVEDPATLRKIASILATVPKPETTDRSK